MIHRTLVNGTEYQITAGMTGVSGTIYNIKSGVTQNDGTLYSINFGEMVPVHLVIDGVPSLCVMVGDTIYGDGTDEKLTVPEGTSCAIGNIDTGSVTTIPTRFDVREYWDGNSKLTTLKVTIYSFNMESVSFCEIIVKRADESTIIAEIYYTSK